MKLYNAHGDPKHDAMERLVRSGADAVEVATVARALVAGGKHGPQTPYGLVDLFQGTRAAILARPVATKKSNDQMNLLYEALRIAEEQGPY